MDKQMQETAVQEIVAARQAADLVPRRALLNDVAMAERLRVHLLRAGLMDLGFYVVTGGLFPHTSRAEMLAAVLHEAQALGYDDLAALLSIAGGFAAAPRLRTAEAYWAAVEARRDDAA